jgi:hypothetical protein
MDAVPETVGALAEGILTAQTVEPPAGGGDGHTHETLCLNCGALLDGPYCKVCGQRGHVHRTLGAFFHDLLHGVLHFEGKIWRTLPLLVWQPGKLTREYIDGRRASYVSPIALFLFVVFLTFAAISATGQGIDFGDEVSLDGKQVSIPEARTELNARLTALAAQRRQALDAGQSVAGIDEEIAGVRGALRTVEAIDEGNVGAFTTQIAPAAPGEAEASVLSLSGLLSQARANPELLIYKLQSNAYKFSWLLIPISVPFLWLLFPFNRRFRLYDHTVFVTYSLSFMMLIMTIATAGAIYDFAPLVMIPVLYAPFHMYRQLRGTYGISRLGAVWRTLLLTVFAFAALALWAIALLGLVLG